MNVKYLAVAAVLMGAASFTSCSNQEDAVAEIQTKTTCPKVINVKVDGGTRAVMGDGNKPMWEEYTPWSYDGYTYTPESGDMLEVYSYNEEGKVIMAFYACTDAATSEFTLMEDYFDEWDDEYDNIIGTYTWEDQETYTGSTSGPVGPYLVYYSQNIISHADMVNKTISPSQPYNQIKPVPSDLSNAIMACCTENLNNCTLKNVMALLKVTIPTGANVNYISLKHYGAEEATYSFETKSWGDYSYDGTSSMTIGTFAYPTMYASTADDIQPIEAGTYYFPLYPQTLISSAEKPFCFKLTYTTGKWEYAEATGYADPDDSFFTTKTKTGSVTLEAGKIYDLGTLTVDF